MIMSDFNRQRKFPVGRLFWALLFIAAALLLLLDAAGVTKELLPENLSLREVLLGAVGLWVLLWGCVKAEPFAIFFALAAEIILFDEFFLPQMGIMKERLAPTGVLLLAAFLLSVGVKMLQHIFRQQRTERTHTERATFKKGWTGMSGKVSGSATRYFDCSAPFEGYVENNLGSMQVYFSNTTLYCGGSTVRVENNLGAVVLHVPEDWLIIAEMENNLGSVKISPSAHADQNKKLYVRGENNLGSVQVEYVASEQQSSAEPAPDGDARSVLEPDEVLPKE
jgi:predicted membrane protein